MSVSGLFRANLWEGNVFMGVCSASPLLQGHSPCPEPYPLQGCNPTHDRTLPPPGHYPPPLPQGCSPQDQTLLQGCTPWDHTPHPLRGQWDTVGKRAVRILLECFLVGSYKYSIWGIFQVNQVVYFLLGLDISGCPSLKTPPKEIRAKGFNAVYAYLKRLQTGSVVCKRTKLMLVGLGGAGKTR